MGDEARETLDDLVPGELVAQIAGALDEFDTLPLPYEAVVYDGGEVQREALAKAEAARIKSESLYGAVYLDREVEPNEEDPERITITVRDPTKVARDEGGEEVRG